MSFISSHKEQSLIKALVEGDKSAFREIYIRNYTRLKYFVLRYTKSEYVAEEIVQEVFIKVWVNRDQIKAEKPIEPYIYRIARNHTFNYLKKAAYQQELKDELSRNMQRVRNATEEMVASSELGNLLEQALQKLTPKKRMIYELSREQGKSLDEIAQQMNLSKKTVKNHLWEALTFIRKELQLTSGVIIPLLLIL